MYTDILDADCVQYSLSNGILGEQKDTSTNQDYQTTGFISKEDVPDVYIFILLYIYICMKHAIIRLVNTFQ